MEAYLYFHVHTKEGAFQRSFPDQFDLLLRLNLSHDPIFFLLCPLLRHLCFRPAAGSLHRGTLGGFNNLVNCNPNFFFFFTELKHSNRVFWIY